MAKSVDKIVKSLDKIATQLQACVVSCGDEMVVQEEKMALAQNSFNVANNEAARAKRIHDKIKELIK